MKKIKEIIRKNKFYVSGVVATSVAVVPSVAFADDDLTTITNHMTGVFDSVKTAGIAIVTTAISMGVIFIGAKWLWGKTRQWLAKV